MDQGIRVSLKGMLGRNFQAPIFNTDSKKLLAG